MGSPHYPLDVRRRAVELVHSGTPSRQVARTLKIRHHGTVLKWAKNPDKYLGQATVHATDHATPPAPEPSTTQREEPTDLEPTGSQIEYEETPMPDEQSPPPPAQAPPQEDTCECGNCGGTLDATQQPAYCPHCGAELFW